MQYIRCRKHVGGSNRTLLWVIPVHIATNLDDKKGGTEMKQRTTLVVAVIILCIAVAAQAEALIGPVSMVEEWVYKTEERFSKIVEIWDSHSVKTYDIKGNIVEETQYSSSAALTERVVHSYDSNSCNIESVYYTGSGAIDRRIERQFDSTGREIQIEAYDGNGRLTSRTLEEYEGNLRRMRAYEADGTLSLAIDEEIDSFGNVTRMVLYDEETGSVEVEFRQTYTSDGKILMRSIYGEDEKLLAETRYSYSYGENGMDEITTATSFIASIPSNIIITGTVVETDSFGNWTEIREYTQEKRFGQSEWVLTSIKRRVIIYRR